MKITTKGRYALHVMIDLAENDTGKPDEYIKLSDIAERQGLSEKYLESIIALLNRGGFVMGVRGKGGGYKLARPASECTVAGVLRCTEGSLQPVPCLDVKPISCPKAEGCKTLPVWEGLGMVINEYLESVTVEFLAKSDGYKNGTK